VFICPQEYSSLVSSIGHDCHFQISHVWVMDSPDNVKVHGSSSVELLHCSVSDPVLVSTQHWVAGSGLVPQL
jgi:hypothetical protein